MKEYLYTSFLILENRGHRERICIIRADRSFGQGLGEAVRLSA
jgi:hypothetical protein